MEVIKKKKVSLYWVFIRYLFRFCMWTVCLAVLLIGAYLLMAGTGAVRMADYEQVQIEEQEEKIRESDTGEEALIPDSCRYGVYDAKGRFLRGTFGKDEAEEVLDAWEQGERGRFYNTFYEGIEKENGDMVIIQYQLTAKFANPILRKLIPSAELFMLVLFLLLFLLGAWLNARDFGRYLKKRLDTLEEIAVKVGNRDLEFASVHSDIKEIDQVLSSLYLMKEALQSSLKEQWDMQRQKQDQIAALAHDVRTPLTIIRGNAELIQEMDDVREMKDYDQEILGSAADMEQYLSILQKTLDSLDHTPDEPYNIEETKQGEETFLAGPFLAETGERAEALGRPKRLTVKCVCDSPETMIKGGQETREKLKRAVLNVVSNGVDYCPERSVLKITAREEEQFLRITVTDSGPGFSSEALIHGKEQFYQADKSRKGSVHYGMGLYISASILEKCGGKLIIRNSGTGGGQVRIDIPVVK